MVADRNTAGSLEKVVFTDGYIVSDGQLVNVSDPYSLPEPEIFSAPGEMVLGQPIVHRWGHEKKCMAITVFESWLHYDFNPL